MDEGVDAVSFRAHAYGNHFYFRVGSLIDIDREAKQLALAPMKDEDGNEFLPSTRLDYDILVVALGSISNDFNTPGVKQQGICLDSPAQARQVRNRVLERFVRIQGLTGGREDEVS